LVVGEWSVTRFLQMLGNTQDRRRQLAWISSLTQLSWYIFAVGPPRSEMVPVKPGVLSRICSISRMMESSERLWITRPSCSVMEQNEQPANQPRMMFTEYRIISYAGILLVP